MVLISIETPKQCLDCDYLKRIPLDVYLECNWKKGGKLTLNELKFKHDGWRSSGDGYGGMLICTKKTYCKHLKFVKKIKELS